MFQVNEERSRTNAMIEVALSFFCADACGGSPAEVEWLKMGVAC